MAKEPTLLTLPESEIASLLDIELLEIHINNKVVKRQLHPKLPLAILNYTNKATFDQVWDSVTMRCRGLIYDYETGKIVAVPFRKFFNYDTADREETWPEHLPTTEPEITQKLDGSLGILWRYKGRWGVATRGSFDSPQAVWAEDWMNLNANVEGFPKGYTPLFEIIYPDNQIVVKYPFKGCVLIGCINNETGQEMTLSELRGVSEAAQVPVVEGTDQSIEDLQDVDTENEEGYVATWHHEEGPPLKVKIKFATYFRLHRLLTGTSPKRIWEILKDGSSLSELIQDVPTHFYKWAEGWMSKLRAEYSKIEQDVLFMYYAEGRSQPDRKTFALWALQEERRRYASILFKLLDGQSYDDLIWKMVKPLAEHQSTFRKVEE